MVASLRSEMRSYHQAEFVTHEQIGDNSLVPPFSTHTHFLSPQPDWIYLAHPPLLTATHIEPVMQSSPTSRHQACGVKVLYLWAITSPIHTANNQILLSLTYSKQFNLPSSHHVHRRQRHRSKVPPMQQHGPHHRPRPLPWCWDLHPQARPPHLEPCQRGSLLGQE